MKLHNYTIYSCNLLTLTRFVLAVQVITRVVKVNYNRKMFYSSIHSLVVFRMWLIMLVIKKDLTITKKHFTVII
jgi:hypothetical protein